MDSILKSLEADPVVRRVPEFLLRSSVSMLTDTSLGLLAGYAAMLTLYWQKTIFELVCIEYRAFPSQHISLVRTTDYRFDRSIF